MQAPASPQSEVSLILSCGEQAGEVALSIQNAGRADTAVLLGIALANGLWYLPREVVVELERSGNSEPEELVYRGPSGIAGRIDHWIVTLPVRAAFTLTLKPTEFVSTAPARATSPPEALRLRLTGRAITSDLNPELAGMKEWRVWTGSATSNTLRLSDCSR